jgi:predicted GNAT family acetyltransferase
VVHPSGVGGSWRLAVPEDLDLLTRWWIAFGEEALPEDTPLGDPRATVERWIRRVGRAAYVWTVDGRTVSLVGTGSETPNGVRIGPVYTPPEERGRGFASALTAAASQAELDAGRRFCFLFTDLANPTSNHIYQDIGYEPIIDVDVYRFG